MKNEQNKNEQKIDALISAIDEAVTELYNELVRQKKITTTDRTYNVTTEENVFEYSLQVTAKLQRLYPLTIQN